MKLGRCRACGARRPWRKLGPTDDLEEVRWGIRCRNRAACDRRWTQREVRQQRRDLGSTSLLAVTGAQKYQRRQHRRTARRGVYDVWYPWWNDTANFSYE